MTMAMRRAFGKVILLGEHAVVYGSPAIAVGVDRGAYAVAKPLASGPSSLHIRTWNLEVSEDETTKDLGRAFRALVERTRSEIHLEPVRVEAEADLPPAGGLGCSAALGVAIARALDPSGTDGHIVERAMAWEKVFHDNPAGIDAAVSAKGGVILFEKGKPVESVPMRVGLTLCVGHSGLASSTRSMVEVVARLRARRPEVAEKTFQGIAALVANARLALEAGDRFALGRLMDMNQMLLSGLFLSTPEIEQLCDLARGAGAYGAKLTGAGGGGSVIALVNGTASAEPVLSAWRANGFDAFVTRIMVHESHHAATTETSV